MTEIADGIVGQVSQMVAHFLDSHLDIGEFLHSLLDVEF